MQALALAPTLIAGRIRAGRAWIDLLAFAAFAVSSALLLTVLGGTHLFWTRQWAPPAPYLARFPDRTEYATSSLAAWTVLGLGAAILLALPLITLAGAAARMGALGRDRRLAALRLLGATGAEVVLLTALETGVLAAAGGLVGTVLYLVSLPAWSGVTFQATPLAAPEMLLPPLLILVVLAAIVLLAAAAGALGLRQVRISPLGVARRSGKPKLRWLRLLGVPLVVIGSQLLGPLLNLRAEYTRAFVIIYLSLVLFMGVINLVGPWVVQAVGVLLTRLPGPASLIAGRRLLDDPRSAWRPVAGLAFVGFTASALVSIPVVSGGEDDPFVAMLAADLRTGVIVTTVIAFLVAATSTLLNQVVGVLDRRAEVASLDHAGAPRSLQHRVRLTEVLGATVLAAIGSAGLGMTFFAVVLRSSTLLVDGSAQRWLWALLAAGVALVWAASEAGRPVLRGVLSASGPRPD